MYRWDCPLCGFTASVPEERDTHLKEGCSSKPMTDQDRLRALCPHEFGKLRETVPCQICEWPRPHYEIEHNICPCCGFQPGYDRPEYYQWSGQWWAAGDDRKPRILRALEAAERRIAALCDAHEEAFIAKEAAEARVTVLEAALKELESEIRACIAHPTKLPGNPMMQQWADSLAALHPEGSPAPEGP